MENSFIAEIKFGENLLKNYFSNLFLVHKKVQKILYGASAKISVLKILSDCFHCQLIAPLFMKCSVNSSRISFVSVDALLPHIGFCSMSPNLVYSLEDPGIRSPLLFSASIRSSGQDILAD